MPALRAPDFFLLAFDRVRRFPRLDLLPEVLHQAFLTNYKTILPRGTGARR
jgi:hypothetical protein